VITEKKECIPLQQIKRLGRKVYCNHKMLLFVMDAIDFLPFEVEQNKAGGSLL
jgi:hypothetical protein